VADESQKSPGGGGEEPDEEGDDAGEERPTVAPPFDPIAFAREVFGDDAATQNKKITPRAIPAHRPVAPTLSDPKETEAARKRSSARLPPISPPPPPRRATSADVLSLADSHAPSQPPQRKVSSNNVAAVDREWEELATSPPPPMQQELIDSLSKEPTSTAITRPPAALRPPTESSPELEITGEEETAEIDIEEPGEETPEAAPTEQEMHDRVSLGDYTGALEIAEKLLVLDPENNDALQCAESCRGVLKQMYTARIGALDRVPMVMVPRDQLRWLTIDHRAGFVLSLIDGVSSMEMILDVSGMPELDALRILSELVQQRIISFR
jgi:hypothetical protein